MRKKFTLSATTFDDIKSAEAKVNGWWKSGNLKNEKVKLFKVVETYDLKLKFIKRK